MNSKIASNASLGVRELSHRRKGAGLAGAAAVCAMLALAGQAAGQGLRSKEEPTRGDRPSQPTPARVDPRPSSPPPRVETPRPSTPAPAPRVETPRPQPVAPPRVETPKPSVPVPQAPAPRAPTPQTPAQTPRVQPNAPAPTPKVVTVQPKQDAPPRAGSPKAQEPPRVVTPPVRAEPPRTPDPKPQQPSTPRVEAPKAEPPKVVTPPARVEPPKTATPSQPGAGPKVVNVNPSNPGQPSKTPAAQVPPIRTSPGGEVKVTPVKPAPSTPAPSGGGREINVKPVKPVVGGGSGGTVTPGTIKTAGAPNASHLGEAGPARDGLGAGGGGVIRTIPNNGAAGTGRVTRFSDNRNIRPIDDTPDWEADGRGDGRGGGGGRHDRDHDHDWDHGWWHHDRHHHHNNWNFYFGFNCGWYSPTYVYNTYYYTSPYYVYDYYSPYYPGYTIYTTQAYAWGGWTRTYCGPRYFGWYDPWCGWRGWRAPGLSLWVSYGDRWGTGISYNSYSTIVCDPAPRYEWTDFIGEVCDTSVTYTSAPRVVNVDPPAFQPTLFRSDEVAGVMGWNDSPESVAGTVQSVPVESRAGSAAQYLGRIPAGAWEVGYEGDKVVDGVRELHFRGLTPNPRGQRVLIVVHPSGETPRLYAGQRVQVTGRLSEICVDDPFEQAGRLVLSEGAVRY